MENTDLVQALSERPPDGVSSELSLRLLVERGFLYNSCFKDDVRPYRHRLADGVGCDAVSEARAFAGEAIEVRRLDVTSFESKTVAAVLVGSDEQDVGFASHESVLVSYPINSLYF